MNPVEKIASLTKYINEHKSKLTSPVPEKHKNHPESYKDYLKLEITKAQRTIDKLTNKA